MRCQARTGTRVAACIVAIAALGAGQEPSEAPGESAFRGALGEVDRLMDSGEWRRALGVLRTTLDLHESRPYVWEKRPDIELDAKRCLFRTRYRAPKPSQVVSGHLASYSASTGTLRLVYEPGELDDFLDLGDEVLLHPAVFTGDHWLEIQGAAYDPELVLLACAEIPLSAYAVSVGQSTGNARAAQIGVWRDGEAVERDRATSPAVPGEPFRIKLKIDRRSLQVSYGRRKLLESEKDPREWGRLGFLNLRAFERITIYGRAERSWMQGLLDGVEQAAWQQFEETYRAEEHLPQWLLERRADETGDDDFWRALPGEGSAGEAEILSEALGLLKREEYGRGLARVDGLGLGPVSEELRVYLRALFLFALERYEKASENARRLCELDPDFGPGRVLEARLQAIRGPAATAVRVYEELVRDFPDIDDLHGELAWQLVLDGRTGVARERVDALLADGRRSARIDRVSRSLDSLDEGPAWSERFEHESEHYVVASDIDKRTCYRACQTLERAYKLFRKDLGTVRDVKRKFRVYLFAGYSGYLAYTERLLQTRAEFTQGLYSPALEQLLICDLYSRADTQGVVRHEGLHQFLDLLVGDTPSWLTEGLAEYYENATERGTRLETGQVDREHLLVLESAGLVPLREFVHQDRLAFLSDPARHYAQSWAFVHFLLESDDARRRVFERLVSELGRATPVTEALRRAFEATSLSRLDQELRAHVAGLGRSRPR